MDHKKINEVKRSLFDSERAVWRFLARFMDWVYLSTLWLVFSLPVITVGASTTALYSTAYHCIHAKDDTILHRFFSAFRSEFRQSTLSWLLWMAVLGMYGILWLFIISLGDTPMAYALMVSAFAVSFAALGALCWVFPLLARFHVTWKELNLTALRFVLARSGTTVCMIVSLCVGAAVCWVWMFPLMAVPGLLADLSCWAAERSFVKMGLIAKDAEA